MRTVWVVTHRSWIYRELLDGAAGAFDVRHDYGMDVPAASEDDAWWAPTEWMARARRAGVIDHLQSPGSYLLPQLRDDVQAVLLRDLCPDTSSCGPVFAKIAEAKIETLPAQVWKSRADFVVAAARSGIEQDSMVHLTESIIDFEVEVRCFMVGSRVVAASTYLVDGQTEGWDSDIWATQGSQFAADAAQALFQCPSGWVLDVGRDAGGWRVVEANPAWSCSIYNADPAGALQSIVASSTPTGTEFDWKPDPWITSRAQRQALLLTGRSPVNWR